MNDIAGLANIGTDMVKKGDFVWLITMRFHPLWFVDNNQVLILINLLNEVRIAPMDFFFGIIFLVKR